MFLNNKSVPSFLSGGGIVASFHSLAKLPGWRDKLTTDVITGRSSSRHCTTNEVGIGSKQENFLVARVTKSLTSPTEGILNSVTTAG